MLHSPQYLLMLRAERDLTITITITLPTSVRDTFERKLLDAISSDGFGDSARVWNEERKKVVQEAMELHLLPVGLKWVREWLKDEVEENVAQSCADGLREVTLSLSHFYLN
jgi:transcription elongation factor SPT6